MLKSVTLALMQLPERDLRRPLIDTLLWTSCSLLLVGFGLYRELANLADAWSLPASLALSGSILMMSAVTWFLFVIVENIILFFYANSIVAAVERRHYPEAPAASGATWHDTVKSGVRLGMWTVIGNILCLPCYLFVPGANLVLFLLLNGYLLGRGYFDAVMLRRMDDTAARRLWPDFRMEFVVVGAVTVLLLTVPILNLLVPILGLATSVHLIQRRVTPRRIVANF